MDGGRGKKRGGRETGRRGEERVIIPNKNGDYGPWRSSRSVVERFVSDVGVRFYTVVLLFCSIMATSVVSVFHFRLGVISRSQQP